MREKNKYIITQDQNKTMEYNNNEYSREIKFLNKKKTRIFFKTEDPAELFLLF